MQPITYAYNTQVHMPTNMTLFSLVLSRHPPGPTPVSHPSSLNNDSYVEADPQWLHLNLQRKFATLQANVSTPMRRRGAHYKHLHDKKVHSKPKFVPNQCLLVDKPPLASGKNTADLMTSASYNKLQPCKAGAFHIIEVQSHTVVIDKDVVPNVASIHRVAADVGRKETTTQWSPAMLDRANHLKR